MGKKLMKKRIGVITWHYYSNFGSALQAYALQETVKKMGYKVKIINYRNLKFGKISNIKELIKKLANGILGTHFNIDYRSFQDKYYIQTKLIQDEKKLPQLAKKFDIFICGSDQIWAPNVFNPVYMLDFVPKEKKKISYAASIGLDDLSPKCAEEYSRLLAEFYAVSVREKAGADLLKEKCGINAVTVLDPTLLICADQWKRMEKNVAYDSEKKYIFCYFLNEEHNYSGVVKEFAQKNGYDIIGFSVNKDDIKWMQIVNIGPCGFLWLIHNASVVFTDSYHGTVFSLLYHKPFMTFERFDKDDPICQNSRIYQLKDCFGLEGMILNVANIDEIKIKELDYSTFEEKLRELRMNSLNFLSQSLEN